MPRVSQQQTQKLLQKLSPQQIQTIKLLELPLLQFEQRIKHEIEENPVLEEDTGEERDKEEQKEISVEEYLYEDDTPHYKYNANNYSKDESHRPSFLYEGKTFHEYLAEQLRYKSLSERSLTLSKFMIGSLDDDGYLRRSIESISDDLAFSLGMEVPIEELEKILRMVQELEPIGVGARDLRECLLLQLDAMPYRTHSQHVAHKILTSHFEEFSKKHFEKIISRMGLNEDDFRDAMDVIVRLQPKPASSYSAGNDKVIPYITPDFILDYQNDIFDLRLNSSTIPEVKVNRRYVNMMRSMITSEGKVTEDADKEAIQFVKNKIDSAKWFISAIKQRHDTLMRTMQAILNFQREYFTDGDVSNLRPMILKDIATMTGLDVSTVSRVVNSKYVQTNFGVIPLKQLFSEAIQTENGDEVSSLKIKEILSSCVGEEDKRKPLTDEILMEILNDKGYLIARRTVAKYRKMLDIPVARLRKEI